MALIEYRDALNQAFAEEIERDRQAAAQQAAAHRVEDGMRQGRVVGQNQAEALVAGDRDGVLEHAARAKRNELHAGRQGAEQELVRQEVGGVGVGPRVGLEGRPVVDQAALFGLLKKVRDLGIPLVSVNPADSAKTGGSEGER